MTKQNNDWISVDERLPENGQMVLTYRDSFKYGDLYAQAIYIEGKGFTKYPLGVIGKPPTHWQPLSQPPEDKEPQAESTSHEKKPIPLIRDRFIVPCMILSWNKI